MSLNKEIEQFATDQAVVSIIEKDYSEIMKDFSSDTELKDFKIQYESLYNALKQSLNTEAGSIRRLGF